MGSPFPLLLLLGPPLRRRGRRGRPRTKYLARIKNEDVSAQN